VGGIGSGLVTASPMGNKQPLMGSSNRIGVRSSHKRKEVNKQAPHGSNSGYLQSIQQAQSSQQIVANKTPSKILVPASQP